MRTRKEIEESFSGIIVTAGSEELYKSLFELLLDIRDLLKGMREESLYDLVSEARQKEKDKRAEQIKEKLII